MIPVKLAMRNFMCYQDNVPPLYFDGIHTACICGDNGHGKSALIDAMTWALWGKTRAKSDDDLIYLGQGEMEVEFDFAIGQQRYRVIRKHSKPKRRGGTGKTILEFQIATDSAFKVLTGDRISETQQKIVSLMHMDYDTFISSSFLRQGHADQFTKQPPAKRKQVLADILGLSFYDELEEQAKELAKQQESESSQLNNALEEISNELAQLPTYETEFEMAQNQLTQIEKVAKEQEFRLNGLRQEKDRLENKKLQLTQLQEHIAQTERDLKRWNELAEQHHSRVKEYEKLIAQRSAIEEGYAQFIETKRLNDELDQKFRYLATLNERKHQLEMTIAQAGQTLVKDHAVIQSRIKELEATSQKLPHHKDAFQQIQIQLSQLAELEETLNRRRQGNQELQAQVHYLESDTAQLEQEIKEIEEKLNLLLTQSGAHCPLCETDLGAEGIERIKSKYDADRQSKSDSLKAKLAKLARQKMELKSVENEVSQLETRINQDKASAQSRASILTRAIAEAEADSNQLNEETKRLVEIEERLARKDFAPIEQGAFDELEVELVKLNYEPGQHEEIRQHLSSLEKYESQKRKLEEAERLIAQRKEEALKAEEAAQELLNGLETDNQKRQDLALEIDSLPQAINELTQAETEYQTLLTQQQQAQETIWSAKGKLNYCSELEIKRKEKERLLGKVSKEGKIYKELAEAFGKKGIQALLIEMALPEIEAEANRLLGRMTDNRMHVKIETQRETKRGDLQETLDINISDELGMRSYEMFSGGEAFRIDFAVRIALSRLLAKRAGAPLRTLIIDEGFGTQDSVGLEKLKEAINSIQEDFGKLLIITHLDEFKDAFPSRIDVTKTATGSTIEVS